MKYEEVLRGSQRVAPSEVARLRWLRAAFSPEEPILPGWFPNLASALVVTGLLLLFLPAAARGPVGLRAAGEACDGRIERLVPLRASVGALARSQPGAMEFKAVDHCALCHVK